MTEGPRFGLVGVLGGPRAPARPAGAGARPVKARPGAPECEADPLEAQEDLGLGGGL